jgi:2-hydroxy-3-keto-5-methylthiopentenyl-1-phosphate phosphatase
MPNYKIPVVWSMMGYVEVEAIDIGEACKSVMDEGQSLPEGNYLDDSFGIDKTGVIEQIKDKSDAKILLGGDLEHFFK